MAFADKAARSPNIEDTLLAASIEGMDRDDLRVLSILMSWLACHVGRVNADRLTELVRSHPGERVRAFWTAVGRWQGKDRRLSRMAKAYEGPRLDLMGTGTDFHLGRSGEDSRFVGGPLRVPAGILRDRPGDVLTPEELAMRHDAYHYRVMLGPSYRADMWAEFQRDPTLSPAELARKTYGSFATAWQVKRDWEILMEGKEKRPAG